MTVGSILVRSNTDAARFERSYGTADLVITQWVSVDDRGEPLESVDLGARFERVIPDGTTATAITTVWTYVTALDGRQVTVNATAFDPASPITAGIIEVARGRLPAATDEVLLHPDVARDLDVTVGDTLQLARPDQPLEVVGIGRRTADHESPLMVLEALEPATVRGPVTETVVDLPDDVDANRLVDQALSSGASTGVNFDNLTVQTRDQGYSYSGTNGRFDPTTEQLAWGWVVGVLTLTAAGIIIAAAFATSARRQLATVGQLSANGASPRLIRRTLALQGTWSGVAGSVVGVAVGVGGFFLARPLVELVAGRTWTNTVVRPTDLLILLVTGSVAATLAALLPARSLADTSVLSALAGRRPIRPVKPRTVAVGAALFVAGIFLLAVATVGGQSPNGGDNLFVLVAILGGLGVLAGVCLASPLAVGVATAVSSRLGASWRLSGRSLYRTRWRSAAVVTAIAVAGAFAVAAATVATGFDDPYVYETAELARNEAILQTDDVSNVTSVAPGVLAEVREVMAPSAESMVFGVDLPAPSDEQMQAAWEEVDRASVDSGVVNTGILTGREVTVVDDEFIDAMGLSGADRANLERVGALSLVCCQVEAFDRPGRTRPGGVSTVSLLGADRTVDVEVAEMRDGFRNRNGATALIMTEAGANEAGLDVVPIGIRFTSSDDLTDTQRRALDDIRFGRASYQDAWILDGESAAFQTNQSGRIGFWITYQWVQAQTSPTLVQAGIIAATLLLVLIVVAIGLSLAAVESRDERNTLICVGASPATLRRRSATTATLLAVTGGVVAVPTGLIPLWVVLRVQEQQYDSGDDFTVPWLSIVAIVVVIPIIVGAIALIGSAIVQRLRPPKVMQAFTD
jgi:putative ABC transport system permease protein